MIGKNLEAKGIHATALSYSSSKTNLDIFPSSQGNSLGECLGSLDAMTSVPV